MCVEDRFLQIQSQIYTMQHIFMHNTHTTEHVNVLSSIENSLINELCEFFHNWIGYTEGSIDDILAAMLAPEINSY